MMYLLLTIPFAEKSLFFTFDNHTTTYTAFRRSRPRIRAEESPAEPLAEPAASAAVDASFFAFLATGMGALFPDIYVNTAAFINF